MISKIGKAMKVAVRSAMKVAVRSAMSSPLRNVRAMHGVEPLLPPIMLYRRILRAHRTLPVVQRELGDRYVKSEFRLHKSTENPLHIVGFLQSWQQYLGAVTGGRWNEGMAKETFEKLSPEQVGQLHELMKAAAEVKDTLSSKEG